MLFALLALWGCDADPGTAVDNEVIKPVEGDGSSVGEGEGPNGPGMGPVSLKPIVTPTEVLGSTLPPLIVTPPNRQPGAPPPDQTPPDETPPDETPPEPAVCNNGSREEGEPCDPSVDDCCNDDCSGYIAAGTICRAAQGECDLDEVCNGESGECPPDRVADIEVLCRQGNGDPCDAAEFCTGEIKTCPADVPAPLGTVCGQPTQPCDEPELCDGVSTACPSASVSVAEAGTVCRGANGSCDVAETCDGVSLDCPADQAAPRGTECRAANGICDVAETCDGSFACPTDAFAIDVLCRNAELACDAAELCDGTGPDCPDDEYLSGTVCRFGASECDSDEVCAGDSPLCPDDVVSPDGTECHAGAGQCSNQTCCPGQTVALSPGGLCTLDSGENVVFVSEAVVQGDVTATGADQLCNSQARSANLTGRFHAWMSNTASRTDGDAVNRVGSGPFARVDGTIVANGLIELIQGGMQNPISLTQWGQSRDSSVWTGTSQTGLVAIDPLTGGVNNCGDWTNLSVNGLTGTSTSISSGWTANAVTSCDQAFPLYCFQDDPRVDGPVVFVTSAQIFFGDGLGGLDSADAFCSFRAQQAGLGGLFAAWMSDSTSDARDRIPDRAYTMLDGRVVATSMADLTDGSLAAPIQIDENGNRVGGPNDPSHVWTGTDSTGRAAGTCNDWVPSDAAGATVGNVDSTSLLWTESRAFAQCFGPGRLYCFQIDG